MRPTFCFGNAILTSALDTSKHAHTHTRFADLDAREITNVTSALQGGGTSGAAENLLAAAGGNSDAQRRKLKADIERVCSNPVLAMDVQAVLSGDSVRDSVHDSSQALMRTMTGTAIVDPEDRIDTEKKLGEGNFGEVFKQKDPQTGRYVAVKVDKSDGRLFAKETDALRRSQGEGVIELVNSFQTKEGEHVVVQEFANAGDLSSLNNAALESEEVVQQIFHDCVAGLATMARAGIVHNDIKGPNIFVTNDDGTYHAKIGDFGLATDEGTYSFPISKLIEEVGVEVQEGDIHITFVMLPNGGSALESPPDLMHKQFMLQEEDGAYYYHESKTRDQWAMGTVLYGILKRHVGAAQNEWQRSMDPNFYFADSLMNAMMFSLDYDFCSNYVKDVHADIDAMDAPGDLKRTVKLLLTFDPVKRNENFATVAELNNV